MDAEGYPLPGLDLMNIRATRQRVNGTTAPPMSQLTADAVLRTDFKALMKQMEENLFAFHEQTRQSQTTGSSQVAQASGQVQSGTPHSITAPSATPSAPVQATPANAFAWIDQVFDGSPAAEAVRLANSVQNPDFIRAWKWAIRLSSLEVSPT